MIIPKYTLDDFKKLPLRAIVAFAARCTRRVEQLSIPPDDYPEHERCRSAIRDAIQMAEDFARGLPCTSCESVIPAIEASRDTARGDLVREDAIAAVVHAAYAAATALHAVALRGRTRGTTLVRPPDQAVRPPWPMSRRNIAALDAFTAAVDASDAVGYSDEFHQRGCRGLPKTPQSQSWQLSAGWTADRPFDQWPARPTLAGTVPALRSRIHETVISCSHHRTTSMEAPPTEEIPMGTPLEPDLLRRLDASKEFKMPKRSRSDRSTQPGGQEKKGTPRSVRPGRPDSGAFASPPTKPAGPPKIPQQYECGPVHFSGDENASYERHLLFDHAVDPKQASDRDQFEALARSLRDLLTPRWLKTQQTYDRRRGDLQSDTRQTERVRVNPPAG